jgi:hypothetical protein
LEHKPYLPGLKVWAVLNNMCCLQLDNEFTLSMKMRLCLSALLHGLCCLPNPDSPFPEPLKQTVFLSLAPIPATYPKGMIHWNQTPCYWIKKTTHVPAVKSKTQWPCLPCCFFRDEIMGSVWKTLKGNRNEQTGTQALSPAVAMCDLGAKKRMCQSRTQVLFSLFIMALNLVYLFFYLAMLPSSAC